LNWLNFFETKTPLRHSFGRCINAKLAPNEEELFNKSYEAFETQNILDAYEYFFKSLENFSDKKSNQNVLISREQERLNFTIFQGSAKITGHVTKEQLYAESTLCKSPSAHVALKRYILERNYQLTYANYFSDDEYIKLKLHHDNSTITPQKIFFPLRELAINIDKEKELLLDEFNDLEGIELDHIEVMDSHLKETKLRFFREWIDKTEQNISLMPTQEQSGAIAFVWLVLLLKIDYFVTPRGKLGYDIYEAISEYYLDDNKLVEEKNDALEKAVVKLKELDSTKLSKSLYQVKQTFDIFNPNTLDEVHNFINETLAKAIWYKEHRYEEIMLSIYEYLGLYTLYNFDMNSCLRELVQLNVRLHNTDFYSAIGYESLFKDEKLNSSKLNALIKEIINKNTKQYPHLLHFEEELNYETIEKFHHSFFLALNNLNFSEL